MIQKLSFKFGSGDASSPLEFNPGAVTVFVGPNNSGKSLLLREIEAYIDMNDDTATRLLTGIDTAFKIIRWIEPDLPDENEVERLLHFRDVGDDPEWGTAPEGYIMVGKLDLVYDRYQSRSEGIPS